MSARAMRKLLARHYGTIESFREAMLAAAKGAKDEENTTEAYQDASTISAASARSWPMRWSSSSPKPRNVKALGRIDSTRSK